MCLILVGEASKWGLSWLVVCWQDDRDAWRASESCAVHNLHISGWCAADWLGCGKPCNV